MTTTLRDQLQQHLSGAYTLERELAGGGMSHVFVAEDIGLGRKVVVKVLREDLTDGLSAERFKREVRVAARLQHPHIVPLLAAGTLDGTVLYYTMPFVEGESLRGRLDRDGALPVGDVRQLLRDIASALAYAHRQGIIHRDIKPENILLPDGGAVVTDFGIAKAIQVARTMESEGDGRKSSTLTQRGMSLGTPAYMAPEQAMGDMVDHRADLYALGVVLYEMLAGRAPFDGRSTARLLAAHATELPEPIDRRRASVPAPLAALVMQLLEKEPADRPQSAEDVLRALDAIPVGDTLARETARRDAASVAAPRDAVERRGSWMRRATDPLVMTSMLVALASAAIALWLGASRRTEPTSSQPRARLTLELPADASPSPTGPGSSMAFSPDGSALVYRGGSPPQLYVRRLNELTPHALTSAEFELPSNPQFSPDGRWIGFLSRADLWKVPANGGLPTRVVAQAGRFAWTPDGTIVFTRWMPEGVFLGGLRRLGAGGTAEPITTSDAGLEESYGSPTVLPDGKTVIFTALSTKGELTLAAVRLGDPKVVQLGVAGGSATYLEGGYLVFAQADGRVAAVRFDARRLRVIGEPVVVLDSVAIKGGLVAELAVAPNGTLAYLHGTIGSQLVEVDRRGGSNIILSAVQNYNMPRVSPDGRRIALAIGQPPYTGDVWVYDKVSRTLTKLTTDGRSSSPEWSPDGRRIAWTSSARATSDSASSQTAVWWQPWDKSGPPELLLAGAEAARFTPRGDGLLAVFKVRDGSELRFVPLPVDSSRPMSVVLPARRGSDADPFHRLSPDGRWLAYIGSETGTREVYVQPFPGPGGHFQISTGGGTSPRWAPSGKELFYRGGCCLMSATIATTPELTVVRRDTLFSMVSTRSMYDVTPDGNHFVMGRATSNVMSPVLVFGWADEVRERVAAAAKK